MKNYLLMMLFWVWLLPLANAQTQVSGTVTDQVDNQPLPGVNILIKGTSNGTVTDINGAYSITVPDGNATLVFSFIGYQTIETAVANRSVVDVSLNSDVTQLSEVVVTALGIQREAKALGYAVTQVQGESLTQARENNVTNALVGKVAGLNVNSTAGGAGASSNVIIRGVSSIGQNTQPLYVINGVPMESEPNANSGSQWDNAPDRGDAISNINPDDIESISVLKGAAASALYGYRAKAGVILITTKSAKSGDGITFNSNYVAEQIIDLTDWQYVYGQAANNRKPADATEAAQVGGSSWGGKLDGTMVPQFDGVERPYVAQKNNLENFYRVGGSWTNTIAFNKNFDNAGVRFSASNLSNNSVVPNSGLDRQTYDLSGYFNPVKNLTIDARLNYILEKAENRPFLSDGPGNANYNVMFLPTSIDVKDLDPEVNPDGSERAYNAGNTFSTNPWFAARKFVNNTDRERLIGSFSARYNFENGLFIQGRAGRDTYHDRYTNVVPVGTAYRPKGSIIEQITTFNDVNLDGLIGKTFDISERVTLNPLIGASYRRIQSTTFTNNGTDFAGAGVYNIGTAINTTSAYNESDQEVQSLYGSLEIAYNEMLYLTATARKDWFSTLAALGKDNNLGKFYPSFSASFVFSELLDANALGFGKLRLGYAVVGQATNPHQTQLAYVLFGSPLGSRPLGTIQNANIPNDGLIASEASEFEIGTDLRFFQNRLSLDLTYYNKVSTNEIIAVPASVSSGYEGAILNTGKMINKGVEALISVTPVRSDNFTWVSSLNGAYNKNTVESLAKGQESSTLGTSRSAAGFVANVVGKPFGQVMAFDYKYDDNGEIVLTANGIPARGELTAFGTAYHPLTAGWNNDFSYKNFNLGVLIDGKWGGKIFSASDFYGYTFGLHKATLENREGKFGPDEIDAATYYAGIANNVSKRFVQDASFIKLRQVALGYTLPSSLFNNKLQSITISLVGRNLFYINRKTDNIDPEANYTANVQGLELGGVPAVRSYGVNLNIKL